MTRVQFILKLKEMGQTDEQIAELVRQHEHDRVTVCYRKWERYLPNRPKKRLGRPPKEKPVDQE
jgi:hypothetical protein